MEKIKSLNRAILYFAFSILSLSSCGGGDEMVYRPSLQIMPAHIQRLALQPFANRTQQFALEDKLTAMVTNRFLTDGTYKISSLEDSDGVLMGEISRYLHLPVAYDANLIATQYKLDIIVQIKFVDRKTNEILWEEPNLVGSLAYPVASLPGGMTEEQAREIIWEQLSRNILKRTVKGFGSVSGESLKKIAPVAPAPEEPAPSAPASNP